VSTTGNGVDRGNGSACRGPFERARGRGAQPNS
jgi:hypothetical protein